MGEDSGALIITAAFAAAALYLSWYLSKGVGDLKTGPVAEDEGPSTQVSQGAFIPYVIGRARVGVLYAWNGNRTTELVSRGTTSTSSSSVTKGSKKKKSRSSLGFATLYLEDAFCPICVGPAEEMVDVFFAGKSVLVGEQSPAPTFLASSLPSGSSLPTTNSKGTLREAAIYWGELDQPGDAKLQAITGTGSTSRWPLVCYLQLRSLLGEVPRWPLMDVEIMTTIVDTGSVTLSSSTPKITTATYTDLRQGLNGAHILAQLLFGSYPYGMDLDPALFDIPSLEALGVLLSGEGIISSVVGTGGESYRAMIGQLMQDLGVMISWDTEQGKWTFVPIRAPTNVPVIPADMVNTKPVEIQVRHDQKQAEKISFRFFDVDRRFRPTTINVGSDSATLGDKTARTRTVQIRATTDFQSASKIAERRSQEVLGTEARYKFQMSRNAVALYPGRTFFVQGLTARLRVRTMKPDPLSGLVDIDAMEDSMGVDPSTFFLNPPPELIPLIRPANPDERKKILEVPLFMLGVSDPPAILVPRIRANQQINRADIHLSDDNVTYNLLGSTRTIQTGGDIHTGNSLPIGPPIQAVGPEITLLGQDDDVFQNLTTALGRWRDGDQVVCINEELMYVQNFVSVGLGRWRMEGIIRARMGTVQENHVATDTVLVFDPQEIFDGSDSIIVSSNQVWVKTQPATLGARTDLATEVPVDRVLYMTGHRPLPPCNLRVQGNVNQWSTTDDVTLEWSYKTRLGGPIQHGGNGSGAGMAPGGTPVSYADPEGDEFILRVYDDPTGANTLVHTETVTPGAAGLQSFTFTNANLQTYLGAEETFAVELTEKGNGLESSPVLRLTVTFV